MISLCDKRSKTANVWDTLAVFALLRSKLSENDGSFMYNE